MFIEIDEGFPDHPKTIQLCAALESPTAFAHLLHFWKWACRCCKRGDLRGLSAYVVEEAARYTQHDGRLFAAMCAKIGDKPGFIDVDEHGQPVGIHNWMSRTGAAILKMEQQADAKRIYRAHRDGKCVVNCPHCGKEKSKSVQRTSSGQGFGRSTGQVSDNPTTGGGTSDTDQTRPDQTRPDPDLESPPARAHVSDSPIRPTNAHDLIHCLRVAVEKYQPQNGLWNPGNAFAAREARSFVEGFADIETALPDIERRIEIFAKDPAMAPWTVAKFTRVYNAIGVPKRKVLTIVETGAPMPANVRVGHVRAEDMQHSEKTGEVEI